MKRHVGRRRSCGRPVRGRASSSHASSVVPVHEMFEGGPAAMTLAQPKPSACSAHHCSTHFSCDGGSAPKPGNVVSSQLACGAVGGGEGFPTPQKDRHTCMGWGSESTQNRVWTVSTPWASDSVVAASDWLGLGRFLGEWRICKESGWFESHLGHVFPCSGAFSPECAHFVL